MKNIQYTKAYGEPYNFTMECWFCHQPTKPSLCRSEECLKYAVNYVFLEEHNVRTCTYALTKAQFAATLDSREYLINYLPLTRQMEVIERIALSAKPVMGVDYYLKIAGVDYAIKDVFVISCDSLILTPQNVKDKLPTLITFS